MESAQTILGDVVEFTIPCHPFNPQIRHLLSLENPIPSGKCYLDLNRAEDQSDHLGAETRSNR